ncbi:uncharacterized protein LOC110028539 [Phalaenopsis equestris]|uniref:uncharacterized protein LOC110028539 n=1 Tax=Phalaenopsis equestris TaxID=78828 RepID=UPI0009E60AED|nr:uncharacterized protein LOC110028539 [Phalaenopsis equestris]
MMMAGLAAPFFLLCAFCHVATAITDGLLPNGNFEQGPNSTELNGTVIRSRRAIPQWEVSGFVEYIPSGHKQGDMLLVVPEGSYAVRLGNDAFIRQSLLLTPSLRYSLTFCAARTCAQSEHLNISLTPYSGLVPIQTTYSSSGWDSYAWAFLAQQSPVDLVIHNPGLEDDPACGPLIDAVAIRELYPPRPTNKNLLKNPGFEEGPFFLPNSSYGIIIPPNIEDDHSPLPAWKIVSLKAVKYIDAAHFAVAEGRRAVELVAGRESAIAQTVRTVVGRKYALTFAVGDAGDGCVGSMAVEAFAARETVKIPYESKGNGGHKRAVLKFSAVGERTNVVFQSSFYHMRSDGALCGPVVDDVLLVSVRSVPASASARRWLW